MYNSEHFIRENKRGGGVSLMINKLIPYTNRVDLVPNNAHFEAVFVETEKQIFGFNKPVIIGIIYRPPNLSISSFNTELEILIESMNKEKKYSRSGYALTRWTLWTEEVSYS